MGVDEIRPLYVELGVNTRSDGSAQYCQGDTTVLATIVGPGEVRQSKELVDKCVVEVYYKPKIGKYPQHPQQFGIEDKTREIRIRNSIEPCILRTFYPRTSVVITVYEMENRGSRLSSCINSTVLALMDAGIGLKYLLAAVTVAVTTSSKIILDPTDVEMNEESTSSIITFVFGNNHDDNLVSTIMERGKCNQDVFKLCLDSASKASKTIFDFYRQAIAKKFSKEDS